MKKIVLSLLALSIVALSGCDNSTDTKDSSNVTSSVSSSNAKSDTSTVSSAETGEKTSSDITETTKFINFSDETVGVVEVKKIKTEEGKSIVFTTEDSYIYYLDDGLYRHFFSDDSDVKIGDFNFNMTDFNGKLIGDKIFFYSSPIGCDLGDVNLYEIDLSKNSLQILKEEYHYGTLISTSACSDGMLAFFGDVNDDKSIGETYVTLYDANKNDYKKLIEYSQNYTEKTGDAIISFDCQSDIIYLMVQNFIGEYRLDTYDIKGNLLKQYSFSDLDSIDGSDCISEDNSELANGFEYFNESSQSDIQVCGDYIFISNLSSEVLTFRIKDDTLVPTSNVISNFYSPSFKNNLLNLSEMMCCITDNTTGCKLYTFDMSIKEFKLIDLSSLMNDNNFSDIRSLNLVNKNQILVSFASDKGTSDGAYLITLQ